MAADFLILQSTEKRVRMGSEAGKSSEIQDMVGKSHVNLFNLNIPSTEDFLVLTSGMNPELCPHLVQAGGKIIAFRMRPTFTILSGSVDLLLALPHR